MSDFLNSTIAADQMAPRRSGGPPPVYDRQLMDPGQQAAVSQQARTSSTPTAPRVPPVEPPESTREAWAEYEAQVDAHHEAVVALNAVRQEAAQARAEVQRAQAEAIRARRPAPATEPDTWDARIADAERLVAVHQKVTDEARRGVEAAYYRAGGQLLLTALARFIAARTDARAAVAATGPALARCGDALDELADIARTYVAPRVPADVYVNPADGVHRDLIGRSLGSIVEDVPDRLGTRRPALSIPGGVWEWLNIDPPVLDPHVQELLQPYLVDEEPEPDGTGPTVRRRVRAGQDAAQAPG